MKMRLLAPQIVKKNPYRGSKFEDFLSEQGILDEITASTQERVLAWQIAQRTKNTK